MKTAEEIAIEFAQNSGHSYTQVDNFVPHDWVVKAMIEFAKEHVEKAINEVKMNASWGVYQNDGQEPFYHESNLFIDFQQVDEDEILKNIK